MVSDELFNTRLRRFVSGARLPFCCFPVLLVLYGCMDASTHGGDAPDHVVISGTPTWSNGIGRLMAAKCAVCHQVPRLPSSPQNVPADLDLRYETGYGNIRAGDDIVAQIKLGVLRHTIEYKAGSVTISTMPLPFGTPLYEDEKTALETWADNVVTAEAANTSPVLSGTIPMTAADGALLYKRHCQSCHGMYGAGGLVQWPLRYGSGANVGALFATKILSTNPVYPMNGWPVLVQFANQCTPSGAPTSCNGKQLDAIAAYLGQF